MLRKKNVTILSPSYAQNLWNKIKMNKTFEAKHRHVLGPGKHSARSYRKMVVKISNRDWANFGYNSKNVEVKSTSYCSYF